MERKVKTDEWLQTDTRARQGDSQDECQSTKQHETRCWNRTIFVPTGMQPIDIINAYPFELPLPPFHSGQMGVNKHDVECIASAMVDPNLRWRNMGDFMIAPCEAVSWPKRIVETYGLNPKDYEGEQVLLTGHHRFLALLLFGIPPAELPPLQVRTAPMPVPYVFPWSIVEWGA
ncbi:MAG: hypothetical protein JXM69_13295 [Anaerolineae bacterium]|nr:hypothetical protein [Anaerolineae bacterium]